MASRKPIQRVKPTQRKKTAPIVDRAEMSPKEPMPFEGGSGFTYVADARYMPFLSPDNNYGQLLLESRLLSATHNACIITKRDYCAGSGFRHSDNAEISKELSGWFSSMNLKDEKAVTVNKKIFEDFFTWGNVPIELVRFSVAGKRYMYVYVHNLLEWRLGSPDGDDVVHYAVRSKLFLSNKLLLTPDEYKQTKRLPIYNARNRDKAKKVPTPGYNWITDENGAERTLIWYKHSTSGFPHYGVPSAVSSMIYQILEYKGARYNLDNFENNMVVSAVLALKGSISQPEADRIGKKAISVHTGDGKRGRVIVVASEEGIDGSDFHNMDTHKEGSYKDSDVVWSEKVILANQWDAILAGVVSPSSLGKGSGFLTKILEVKKNSVIKPAQNDLIENVWRKVLKIGQDWLGFKDNIDTLEIADTIDISGLTDVDITPTVTVNEVRSGRGLADLKDKKKGEMLLGELGNDQKKGVYVKDTSTKNNV